MHPSVHHLEKYASGGQLGSGIPHLHGPREVYTADGHPGSGLPPHLHSPREVYPPQYINTSSSVHSNSIAVPRKWSTGLCHCCDDFSNCVVTCFCPCITFGQIAEIVNKGSSSCASNGVKYALLNLTGFACLYSCFYRSKLRGQYDLEEGPCVDCLVHFFCCFCALCQEYRELKSHGFDMGIGWEANLDRQRRGVTVAPIVGSGMTR